MAAEYAAVGTSISRGGRWTQHTPTWWICGCGTPAATGFAAINATNMVCRCEGKQQYLLTISRVQLRDSQMPREVPPMVSEAWAATPDTVSGGTWQTSTVMAPQRPPQSPIGNSSSIRRPPQSPIEPRPVSRNDPPARPRRQGNEHVNEKAATGLRRYQSPRTSSQPSSPDDAGLSLPPIHSRRLVGMPSSAPRDTTSDRSMRRPPGPLLPGFSHKLGSSRKASKR